METMSTSDIMETMSTSDRFKRSHGYTECQFPYGQDAYDYVTIRGGEYLAQEIDILRETVRELQETVQELQEQIWLLESKTEES